VNEYPIVNGVLSTTPDRSLSNVPGFFAVSDQGQGELYSSPGPGTSAVQLNTYSAIDGSLLRTLNVFPPNGEHPANFLIASVGIDAQHYIFVDVLATTPPHFVRYSVEVFAPLAQGNEPPVTTFMTGPQDGVGAFAFDSQGDAFLAMGQLDTVAVIATPRSHPTLLRELKGEPLHSIQEGLVIDGSDELYVGCGNRFGGYVLAYRSSASNASQVDRTIRFPPKSQRNLTLDLAVHWNQLYVAESAGPGAAIELNKTLGGFQQPIAEIPQGADRIAYGP
jgi:hypothetical protein